MYPSKLQVLLCKFILFISFPQGLGFQVEITSPGNSSCLYNASISTSEGPVTLYGDLYRSCDIFIKSSCTIKTSISIITSSTTAAGTEYIYLERFGPANPDFHRYIVVKSPLQTCNLSFWYDTIHLQFHGNITVIINANKAIGANSSVICPKEISQQDTVGQTSYCKEIKGYESVIACTSKLVDSKPTTICDAQCSHNCSCILSDREVMYHCYTSHDLFQNKSVFLLFPSDISSLDMSKNGLTALMPDSFKTIRILIVYLKLSYNSLVSLPTSLFHDLLHLTELELQYNSLVSLPAKLFSDLHNLTVLDLSHNSMVSLPVELFNDLHNLTELWLNENSLISLPVGLFNGLQNLNYLNLGNNSLVSLPTELFSGLHRLKKLDISYNSLRSLPVELFNGLQSLHSLYLGLNSLMSLPVGLFTDMYNLTQIWLNHNSLVSLPVGLFNDLHNLTELKLTSNSLVQLPVGLLNGLRSLNILYLGSNSLMSLPTELFNNLHRLQTLYIFNNSLRTLPDGLFNGLQSLLRVDIDSNYLVSLQAHLFSAMHNLQELHIQNNKIAHIAHASFSNTTALQVLYLSNNQLTFLSFNLFDDLINLRTLDLSYNRLTHIPRLGHMTKLSVIILVGNTLTGITHENFDGIQETVTIAVDQPAVCVCYVNESDSCFNIIKRSSYLTCGWLLSVTILSIFTWILGLFATLGNGFVLLWRRLKDGGRENKVQAILLSNLALSDFLMGIYMLIIAAADAYYGQYFPMNAEEWRTGFICRIASTLAITSSEASVFFVTLISIDRFINIKFPYTIHKLHIKSTRLASSVVWCISITLGLIASILAGKNPNFYDNSHICIGLPLAQVLSYDIYTKSFQGIIDLDTQKSLTFNVATNKHQSPGLYFSVAIFICLNMLCFLLILACYIAIIKTVSQTSKEASRQRKMSEEIRMTIKVSAIVLTDFCCWFPICLISALVQVGVVTIPPDTFAWVVTFVLPINSAINPFMYTIGTLIGDKCSKKQSYTHHVQMQTLSTSLPDK